MTEVAAIFDVEGTLFTKCRILWWGILRSQTRDKRNRLRLISHILSQVVLGLLYRFRLMDGYRLRFNHAMGVARLLAGVGSQDIAPLASGFREPGDHHQVS